MGLAVVVFVARFLLSLWALPVVAVRSAADSQRGEVQPAIVDHGSYAEVSNANQVRIFHHGTSAILSMKGLDGSKPVRLHLAEVDVGSSDAWIHMTMPTAGGKTWLGKSVMVVAEAGSVRVSRPFFFKWSVLCGVGLYTHREAAQCKTQAPNERETNLKIPDRAFGVEMELVANTDDATGCWKTAGAKTGWNVVHDMSVEHMTLEQAEKVAPSHAMEEARGSNLEIVSPPIHGTMGLKSVANALAVARTMGVQAPITAGMHVHVNVGRSSKTKEKEFGTAPVLTPKQLVAIYVGFAKYQLVIDELLQTSRPNHPWALPLLPGKCDAKPDHELEGRVGNVSFLEKHICHKNPPCQCFRMLFRRFHDYLKDPKKSKSTLEDLHSKAVGPISEFLTKAFALNIYPFVEKGTVEFRVFGATHSAEHAMHNIRFAVGFVEAFSTAATADSLLKELLQVPADDALDKLEMMQREATIEGLKNDMRGHVLATTMKWLAGRSWETNAVACSNNQSNIWLPDPQQQASSLLDATSKDCRSGHHFDKWGKV